MVQCCRNIIYLVRCTMTFGHSHKIDEYSAYITVIGAFFLVGKRAKTNRKLQWTNFRLNGPVPQFHRLHVLVDIA